jgi:lysophospholipid acyltransferase (LPLAT)-like uncharacterized protein
MEHDSLISQSRTELKRKRSLAQALPFLAPAISTLMRLIHGSCRITVVGRENAEAILDSMHKGGRAISTCWHFALPAFLYILRDSGFLGMASRSRDGDLATGIAESLGYRIFRGSPGKGGATALKQLITAFRKCAGGGFVADGSKGPARVAQKGILILAMYTGAPILPFSMAAKPCWRPRSWDRTVFAMPFGRIVYAFGPLIRIERGASAESIEQYRIELEESLNRITELAEEALRS